jgi:hypothetical protein
MQVSTSASLKVGFEGNRLNRPTSRQMSGLFAHTMKRERLTHVNYFRVADHLPGLVHNFPEPVSWLNEEITWCGMKLTILTEPDTVEAVR